LVLYFRILIQAEQQLSFRNVLFYCPNCFAEHIEDTGKSQKIFLELADIPNYNSLVPQVSEQLANVIHKRVR